MPNRQHHGMHIIIIIIFMEKGIKWNLASLSRYTGREERRDRKKRARGSVLHFSSALSVILTVLFLHRYLSYPLLSFSTLPFAVLPAFETFSKFPLKERWDTSSQGGIAMYPIKETRFQMNWVDKHEQTESETDRSVIERQSTRWSERLRRTSQCLPGLSLSVICIAKGPTPFSLSKSFLQPSREEITEKTYQWMFPSVRMYFFDCLTIYKNWNTRE